MLEVGGAGGLIVIFGCATYDILSCVHELASWVSLADVISPSSSGIGSLLIEGDGGTPFLMNSKCMSTYQKVFMVWVHFRGHNVRYSRN